LELFSSGKFELADVEFFLEGTTDPFCDAALSILFLFRGGDSEQALKSEQNFKLVLMILKKIKMISEIHHRKLFENACKYSYPLPSYYTFNETLSC
jgi:hypothetical protein